MTGHGEQDSPAARCVQCLVLKPLDQFHRDRSTPNGHNRRCKECRNARNRQHVANDPQRRRETMQRWRRDNPERYEAAQRAYKLRAYGLSIEQHAALLRQQEGTCGICRAPETGGWDLAVDHDHATGRVRGLLCRRCNAGIGLLRDDPALLEAAAAYLRRAS